MKLSHAALALALSSSLVLSACTDSDDTESTDSVSSTTAADGADDSTSTTGGTGDNATSTGDAVPTTGDASTATGDAATSTDDGKITAPAAGAGVISVEEAETVAAQLMRTAADSQVVDVDEAAELNEQAFVGSELLAATAATTLRDAGLTPVIDYAPSGANVLAISRDDGESPAFMVVQSVPESGLPELHLMVSQDGGENWKIGWSAPMLAGTKVGTFDPRSEGSTILRDTRGELSNYPSGVVDKLFEILDYPFAEDRPDFRTNDYGPQVRKATEAQAASVSEQATMTSTHALRADTLRTIELEDGSAIMFPVLERTSAFDVKSGMILKPPTAFTHLTGDDTITDSAKMKTLVFLAVHIRTDGGAPEIIAAREQVVSASGS
ncbi:hypothetical protein [Ornithinimicrobium cryptoxanthini]|uniref:hypothetical protein n=1 Tax=Ornithinimicrobium cryptoxanthini TaxID=2934161 RepID=UPI00211919FD|nr:hypothetical protein [Ornithinimicrobium cryptoxanthini]